MTKYYDLGIESTAAIVRWVDTERRRMLQAVSRAVFALIFALPCSGFALAQANGDPGAAMGGQLAARHAEQKRAAANPDKGSKSGANAMRAGSTGGAGGAGLTGGSDAMSGGSAHASPSR